MCDFLKTKLDILARIKYIVGPQPRPNTAYWLSDMAYGKSMDEGQLMKARECY